LVQQLESADTQPPEPLWADVTALQLVADVVRAAFAQHGLPRRKRRQATDVEHAERVEAAKVYLAARLGESIALDDVARSVHASPFHLSRMFRQRTGVPIHRYLTRLRLRASLERLADGAEDITALALDLGFSSHSPAPFAPSSAKRPPKFAARPGLARCVKWARIWKFDSLSATNLSP
jgi:AraC-like DNA-binding protein